MKKSLPILIVAVIFFNVFPCAFEAFNLSSFPVSHSVNAVPDINNPKNIPAQSFSQNNPSVKSKIQSNSEYSLEEALKALKDTAEKLGIIKPSRQITVYKRSNSALEIYTLLSDREILLTRFDKKPWGTWNIGGWYIVDDNNIPSNKFHLLAGGGTDWEYVLSVGEAPLKGYTFSGGNHGKETLEFLKLLNVDDDTELNLEPNTGIKLNSLKIIENTSLYLDDKSNKNYAGVQRTYTISNSRIDLTTDFNFTSDAYMGTSYICMFPVTKKFGNRIKFNGSAHEYSTPGVGKTLSKPNSPNYIGKEKTLSADIWSESNPKYMFNVWIDNEGMADGFNNSLKVFYWDFNESGNKLYFSKYDNNYTKVPVGTVWHNSQGWKLKIRQPWLDSITGEIKKIWLHFMQPNL